jgi:hypothetical protein
MSLGAIALGLLALSAPAAAPAATTITIGQTGSPSGTCTGNADFAQRQVGAGTEYTVPSTGGIVSWTATSWSTQASSGSAQSLTLKFFRLVSGTTYQAVAHDGPHAVTPNIINTFSANVEVKAGDLLGLHTIGFTSGCLFNGATGDVRLSRAGDLADGESGDFLVFSSLRVNASAQLFPTNSFETGVISRNKKKGTATLMLDIPNPGVLTVSGKGVKATVSAASQVQAGTVKLKLAAKGKQRKKLRAKGQVRLKPTITFTPTGGDPNAQTTKVKLKLSR